MDWSVVLSGGVAVALVQGFYTLIMWWLNRRAQKEDNEETNTTQAIKEMNKRLGIQDERLDGCTVGLRVLLHDKIKHLGQLYLQDGEVDFDDRQILIDMHNAYHNGLGGNGNLDALMEAVKTLPMKKAGE